MGCEMMISMVRLRGYAMSEGSGFLRMGGYARLGAGGDGVAGTGSTGPEAWLDCSGLVTEESQKRREDSLANG
jgi:hypothetical protein